MASAGNLVLDILCLLSMRHLTPLRRRLWIIALALGCSLPCFASELAVLRNGFSIRHERRQVMGTVTRLYVSVDGSSYVDVPTLEIEHFEEAPEERASAFGLRAPASPDLRGTQPSQPDESCRAGLHNDVLKPACRSPKPDLNDLVNAASGKYRLDPDLVKSVIKAESGFNVRAVSRKGAQGLMQLMPDTASKLGVPNAFDPQANVEGGTRYLRELLERYNFDLIKALAAYNAGPRRVEQYGGLPPYYETHAYVARIVRDFNKKKIAEKGAGAPVSRKSSPQKTGAQTRVAAGRSANTSTQVQEQAGSAPASQPR